jgi:hypothetical protein
LLLHFNGPAAPSAAPVASPAGVRSAQSRGLHTSRSSGEPCVSSRAVKIPDSRAGARLPGTQEGRGAEWRRRVECDARLRGAMGPRDKPEDDMGRCCATSGRACLGQGQEQT